MNTLAKRLLACIVLIGIVIEASADRGVGRKAKNRTSINIVASSNLKSSIALNLKRGLSYKGSLLNSRATLGNSVMSTALITYKKGNITYIVPYKSKITVPDMQRGYTGMKVIIRKK